MRTRLVTTLFAVTIAAASCGSPGSATSSPPGPAAAAATVTSQPAQNQVEAPSSQTVQPDPATPGDNPATDDDLASTAPDVVVDLAPMVPSASLANLSSRSIDLEPVLRLEDTLAMAVRAASIEGEDGTVHLARQTGEIHRVETSRDGWTLVEDPIFSLAGRTVANKERGLLGFTFSPSGALLYAVWTDRETNDNVLSEYAMAADGNALSETERIVMRIAQPFNNHNGGHIAFGPDGYLYYGLGDGGSADDPLNSGQDTSTLLGAVLRIDPGDQSAGAYAIPATNPFIDGGGRPEIFISGARNPWRFSFDRATGDLWIADVGQDAFEEINVLRNADGGGAGANLGWRIREGFAEFADGPTAGLTDPLFAYPHENGACSVTGGFVYRGEALPQIEGAYIYGDWCSGDIWALSQDGAINKLLDIRVGSRSLASFGETPDGELWVLAGVTVFALVPER